MGDATRLGLIQRLGEDGPASIVRLSDGAGMSRQAVTKHLQVLHRAGLVHQARAGRESLWQLDRETLDTVRQYLEAMSQRWDTRLENLRIRVENS